MTAWNIPPMSQFFQFTCPNIRSLKPLPFLASHQQSWPFTKAFKMLWPSSVGKVDVEILVYSCSRNLTIATWRREARKPCQTQCCEPDVCRNGISNDCRCEGGDLGLSCYVVTLPFMLCCYLTIQFCRTQSATNCKSILQQSISEPIRNINTLNQAILSLSKKIPLLKTRREGNYLCFKEMFMRWTTEAAWRIYTFTIRKKKNSNLLWLVPTIPTFLESPVLASKGFWRHTD